MPYLIQANEIQTVSITQPEPPAAEKWDLPIRTIRAGRVAPLDEHGIVSGLWTLVGMDEGGVAGAGDGQCGAGLAFDGAGVDPATGALLPGPCQSGAPTRPDVQAGNQPPLPRISHIIEDMRVPNSMYRGGRVTRVECVVHWRPTTPEPMVVLVNCWQVFLPQTSYYHTQGFLGGILFEADGVFSAGEYLVTIDLCDVPVTKILLPSAPSSFGAYEIRVGRMYLYTSPERPLFIPSTNATFAMWVTGGGRPGDQTSDAYLGNDDADGSLGYASHFSLGSNVASACAVGLRSVAAAFWARPSCGYPLSGDANCDCRVNDFDIDPFVAALTSDRAGYLHTGATLSCYSLMNVWGDLNGNGRLDNFDIDPFVSCLTLPHDPGQGCQ